MNGIGVFIWPDGKSYKGEYVKDLKEGYGEMEWKDGKIYKGHWLQGKMHGKGVIIE